MLADIGRVAAVGAVAAGVAWYVYSRLKRDDVSGLSSQVVVVLGGQWGDEGKGKLVDLLAQTVDVCARFNGGANAGHTLVVEGKKYAFHLVPCGMMNKASKNLIGNGVVVHIPTLLEELDQLKAYDPDALKRLFISDRAAVLLDTHREIDGLLEAEKSKNSSGALGARWPHRARSLAHSRRGRQPL
jgi:adenylosuccinate synthase